MAAVAAIGELSVGQLSSAADSTDPDLRAAPFVLLFSLSPISLLLLFPSPSSPSTLSQADAMLAAFNIKTIEDLGKWRFYLTARAIATLAKTGQSRGEGSQGAEGRASWQSSPISSSSPPNCSQLVDQRVSRSASQSASSFTVCRTFCFLPTRPCPCRRRCPRRSEEKNKRPAESRANINKALDKEHEKKSLTAVLKEPVSALQGQSTDTEPNSSAAGSVTTASRGNGYGDSLSLAHSPLPSLCPAAPFRPGRVGRQHPQAARRRKDPVAR